jgi:hypothetical protein
MICINCKKERLPIQIYKGFCWTCRKITPGIERVEQDTTKIIRQVRKKLRAVYTKRELFYHKYIIEAQERGYVFDLTIDQFYMLRSKPCAYCGDKGGSIDRIHNTIGYVYSNCAPCCHECNMSKGAKRIDRWLERMRKILDYTDSI